MQNGGTSGLSLSTLSIRQHIGTLMLTLAVIVLGIFFISQIQVDLLPSITYPRIGVRLSAPGVSPEVGVEEITKPLEEALSATEGVVQVYSQTREGQVSLDLFFEPGGNIDQALNDATAAFNRAQGNLPDIVEQPRLFKVDPSQLPVYELALRSPSLEDVDLRVFADEELSRELGVVAGVAAVDVAGGASEEVLVQIDPKSLTSARYRFDGCVRCPWRSQSGCFRWASARARMRHPPDTRQSGAFGMPKNLEISHLR
jgi:multidrug efflux pump subunit AcrB